MGYLSPQDRFPGLRVTDQHRSWIGYTLKGVVIWLLENADSGRGRTVRGAVFQAFRVQQGEGQRGVRAAGFSDLAARRMFSDEDMVRRCWILSERGIVREQVEIKIGALRVAEYISGTGCRRHCDRKAVRRMIRNNVGSWQTA